MDPLSVGVSVLAIASAFLSVSRWLKRYGRQSSCAREEIAGIARDITFFSRIMTSLEEVLKRIKEDLFHAMDASGLSKHLLDETQQLELSFRKYLKGLRGQHASGIYETCANRWRWWVWQKDECNILKAKLESLKCFFAMWMSTLQLAALTDENRTLEKEVYESSNPGADGWSGSIRNH